MTASATVKCGVCLAICLLLAPLFWRTIGHGQPRDFVQEWASARNYLTGHPIYENQEVSLFHHLGLRRQPNDFFLEYNAHPPTSVLLVLPLGWLNYPTAFLFWNLLSLLALILSIVLVFREWNIPLARQRILGIFMVIALAAVGSPLREQLLQGQWNLVLLLLFTAIWLAARREQDWLAGALLGLAIAIKLFPGFLLLLFLLRRQLRVVFSAGLAFVSLTFLTLLFFGTETYRQYIVEVLPALDSFRSAWPGVSLGIFWCRLFDPSPVCGVTIALANNPMLARTLTLGSSAVVVGLLGWVILRAQQATSFDRCYALSMVAMVLVSPLAWDHYLVFLLLPLLLFWNQLSAPRLRWAFVLILLPLVLHRYLFWALLVCDPRLDWTHQVAQPWQALTALSLQTYALVAWFLLGAATMPLAPTTRSCGEDLILCPS
jgi:Glycosyltransferase family 87